MKFTCVSFAASMMLQSTNAFSVTLPTAPTTGGATCVGFLQHNNNRYNSVIKERFLPLHASDQDEMEVDSEDVDTTDEESKEEPPEDPIATAADDDGITMSMTSEEKSKLLQKMLILASSTDRGQVASLSQKESMQVMIEQLQESTSDSDTQFEPTNSPEIEGTWELLYSSTQLFRSSPFFMAGRAVCKDGEEAERYDWFCDMHRAALAISEIGKVRQIISSTRMVSEFEVNVGAVPFLSDFTPLKYSGGLPFTIQGAIVSSADITPTSCGGAWEIFMDAVEIKGSNIPLLKKVLEDDRVALKSRDLGSFLEENVDGYTNPKPIFTTTYLDDDIRISRDQDGKVFVYGKMSDSTEPTDYKGVDGDLGLIGLLEGLNDNFFKFSI